MEVRVEADQSVIQADVLGRFQTEEKGDFGSVRQRGTAICLHRREFCAKELSSQGLKRDIGIPLSTLDPTATSSLRLPGSRAQGNSAQCVLT